MTKHAKITLTISHLPEKADGLVAYLGYFGDSLTPEQSELIAQLIWFLKNKKLSILVATYVFNESQWQRASLIGWNPYVKKTFTRKAWFPRTIQHDWVVAGCPSVACLQEVLYTGWNLSGNESFIILLVQDLNEVLPKIEKTYRDNLETIEENERQWLDYCPFIFSRDHDGLTLRIYTMHLSAEQLRKTFELFMKSYGIDDVVFSTKPL